MLKHDETTALVDRLSELEGPVLTVYADINPANPDNKGGAWRTRIKNALKDIPEIHERTEHRPSLNDAVLELIGEERPAARTMALFAKQNHLGKTFVERIDLQVELPVADLRQGKSEVRYGAPHVEPLLFALDEYQRTAVLHLDRADRARWQLFEIFMGEIEEVDDIFQEIGEEDWKELHEAQEFIQKRLLEKTEPDFVGNSRDTWQEKLSTWRHKLYKRLVRALDKALRRLGADRLVLLGEEPETSHLLSLMPRQLRQKVVARLHNTTADRVAPGLVRELVEPALEEAERAGEMALLDEIREQPGIWGAGPVLEAIQVGRIDTLVVPFRPDIRVWTCPQYELFAADRDTLAELCEEVSETALGDHLFELSRQYGMRLEFVRGQSEERLMSEFDGIAGKRRW